MRAKHRPSARCVPRRECTDFTSYVVTYLRRITVTTDARASLNLVCQANNMIRMWATVVVIDKYMWSKMARRSIFLGAWSGKNSRVVGKANLPTIIPKTWEILAIALKADQRVMGCKSFFSRLVICLCLWLRLVTRAHSTMYFFQSDTRGGFTRKVNSLQGVPASDSAEAESPYLRNISSPLLLPSSAIRMPPAVNFSIWRGEGSNFEQSNFRMAEISNLKINERSNVERPNLRSPQWKMKI